MDTSAKHIGFGGSCKIISLKCPFWVDSTHFFQIQLGKKKKKGFLHGQTH